MYIFMYTYTYIYVCTYIFICIFIFICIYIYTNKYIYYHTYARTHTLTHAHTYTHIKHNLTAGSWLLVFEGPRVSPPVHRRHCIFKPDPLRKLEKGVSVGILTDLWREEAVASSAWLVEIEMEVERGMQ